MPVAASEWPGRFPDSNMVQHTWWQIHRISYGRCGHQFSLRMVPDCQYVIYIEYQNGI